MSQCVDRVKDGGFDGWDYAEDHAYSGGEAQGYGDGPGGDGYLDHAGVPAEDRTSPVTPP